MKWAPAFEQLIKPSWTRREAAALILLLRATFNKFGKLPNVALTNFDWYPFALATLGWEKKGDKFKVDTAFQLQPVPRFLYDQLRAALVLIAAELDDQGVPYESLLDARPNLETFKKLATDAWAAMQVLARNGAKSVTLTHDVIDWPDVVATSPPGKLKPAKQEPEQMPLPGIQPVETPITVAPSPTPEKKEGGGGAWLLLLLAVAGTRQTKRGNRKRKGY